MNDLDKFPIVDNELGKSFGVYLTEDPNRKQLIQAGQTVVSFRLHWKEHERCAHQQGDPDTCRRNFYIFYPHSSVAATCNTKRGTFESLNQRVGISMQKSDNWKIASLFDWSVDEIGRFGQLSYGSNGGGTVFDKKVKHLCYLFELF
mmetsp:Transcript_30157/g.50084  ORF Transcript_30157/g.50084 Transcript_30157/m.50084 type:complete len:147 (+) Transcript_30157:750-1190(+)